jgi:hypothetical protein
MKPDSVQNVDDGSKASHNVDKSEDCGEKATDQKQTAEDTSLEQQAGANQIINGEQVVGAKQDVDAAAAANTTARKSSMASAASSTEPTSSNKRMRTRSLSSAVSSISGDGDGGENGNFFDNDGKTPLVGNRKRSISSCQSHGPVRKRHKGRALFAIGVTPPSVHTSARKTDEGGVDNDVCCLPAMNELKNDGEDSDVLTFPRPRSNTIDSFRAAMDSHADLPSESIILPEMKSDVIGEQEKTVEVDRQRSDTLEFLTKGNPLISPRNRADTVDFLTAAVGGDRTRSDTIDFLTAAVGCDRNRSDTIDFLTAAVGRDIDNASLLAPPSPTKIGLTSATEQQDGVSSKQIDPVGLESNYAQAPAPLAQGSSKKGVAFGKTPKKTNVSRDSSNNMNHGHGPLRKRYRSRSLSFQNSDHDDGSSKPDEIDEDDIATESGSSTGGRARSNTVDSLQNALFGRTRSDTIDFLTAAVAGDMGHDLDAAIAAAAGDGASFAMHPISAPSGASISHHSNVFLAPGRIRSDTLDSTGSSINSAKLDFLVEVAAEDGQLGSPIAGVHRDRADSAGGDSTEQIQRRPRSNTLEIYSSMAATRTRSDTVDFLIGATEDPVGNIDDVVTLPDDNANNGCVLDHLKALCDEPKISGAKASVVASTGILRRRRRSSSGNQVRATISSPRTKFDDECTKSKRSRKNSESTSKTNPSLDMSGQRLLYESIQQMDSEKRNRLESWGGMSDLSTTGMDPTAIAAHHDALKTTGLLDDLVNAADFECDDVSDLQESAEKRKRAGSGGTNSLSGKQKGRPRLDSLASLSLASLSDASVSLSGKRDDDSKLLAGQTPNSKSSTGANSIVVDYDAIAAAVAATDGLDMEAIMGKPKEMSRLDKASVRKSKVESQKKKIALSRGQVTTTPTTTHNVTITRLPPIPTSTSTSVSKPTVQTPVPVRSDPITKQRPPSKPAYPPRSKEPVQKSLPPKSAGPKPFPVASIDIPLVPIPKNTQTEEELEAIRQRARAAAGYIPPVMGATPAKPPPRKPAATPGSAPYNPNYTPRQPPAYPPPPAGPSPYANIPYKKRGPGPTPPYTPSLSTPRTPSVPVRTPSSTFSSRSGQLQSQQKWDDMFDQLVMFIEETRATATKGMTDARKAQWVWDGNVPTNYKTKDGKALGRWINNQRSAKSKGTLKDEREVRLVSTGLKWSVLTTNSWKDMMRELEQYVKEQEKSGRKWDGNVPTNYKIKSLGVGGEEKNLGRWINRQRSLFQSGKLKEDRQRDLERIGLRWSVLLTSSWTSMYSCLCKYADQERRRSQDGTWDGSVPIHYKTTTNPPISLGKWVNRQQSAHSKGRLKLEFVKRLESTGLKWNYVDPFGGDDDYFVGEEFIPSSVLSSVPESVPSSFAAAAAKPKALFLATPGGQQIGHVSTVTVQTHVISRPAVQATPAASRPAIQTQTISRLAVQATPSQTVSRPVVQASPTATPSTSRLATPFAAAPAAQSASAFTTQSAPADQPTPAITAPKQPAEEIKKPKVPPPPVQSLAAEQPTEEKTEEGAI